MSVRRRNFLTTILHNENIRGREYALKISSCHYVPREHNAHTTREYATAPYDRAAPGQVRPRAAGGSLVVGPSMLIRVRVFAFKALRSGTIRHVLAAPLARMGASTRARLPYFKVHRGGSGAMSVRKECVQFACRALRIQN